MRGRFGRFTRARVSDAELDQMIQAARTDIASALDAVLDREADLARIYARYGQQPPARPPAHKPGSQVAAVCDRIAILESAIAAATGSRRSAMLGALYLAATRRILFELRTGLAGRRLAKEEAQRLLGGAEHNLRQAAHTLDAQQRATTKKASRDWIAELRDLTSHLSAQLPTVRADVMRIFDQSDDNVLVPAGG